MPRFLSLVKSFSYAVFVSLVLPALLCRAAEPTFSGAWRADPSFNVRLETDTVRFYRALPLGDGRLLTLGNTTTFGSQNIESVGVLKSDFTPDATFSVRTDGYIYSATISLDGKYVYLTGFFSRVNGVPSPYLAKITLAGNVVDPDFGLTVRNPRRATLFALAGGRLLDVYYPLTTFGQAVRVISESGQEDVTWSSTALLAKFQQIRKVIPFDDGTYLVLGYSSTGKAALARFKADGSFDDTFAPMELAMSSIDDMAPLSDGSVVVVGDFLKPGDSTYVKWALVSKAGVFSADLPSLDTLVAKDGDSSVGINYVVTKSDDTIVIGGSFVSASDNRQKNLVAYSLSKGNVPLTVTPRTHAGINGAWQLYGMDYDKATDSVVVAGYFDELSNGHQAKSILKYQGPSLDVVETSLTARSAGKARKVVELAGGDLMVSGDFTRVNGVDSPGLVRLSPTGAVVRSYHFASSTYYNVRDFEVVAGEKLLVVGGFNLAQGKSVGGIVQLNTDGSVDDTFPTGTGFGGSPANVRAMADGTVYVLGDIGSYNGTPVNTVCRLKASGEIDTDFAPEWSSLNRPMSFDVDAAGNVYFSTFLGYTTLNGGIDSFMGLTKIAPNGKRVKSFNTTSFASAYAGDVALLADGTVVSFEASGNVYKLDATGKIVQDYPAERYIRVVGAGVTPLPDGSILGVGENGLGGGIFKLLPNGKSDPAFVTGDVQLTSYYEAASFNGGRSPRPTVTASGLLMFPALDAFSSSSSSIGLARMKPGTDPRPKIDEISTDVAVKSGSSAALTVKVSSEFPVYYQWYAENDNGGYTAVPNAVGPFFTTGPISKPTHFKVMLSSFATNEYPTIVGTVSVTLGTGPTFSTALPASVKVAPGGDLSLSVVATTNLAPSYQWYYNGVAIEGATSATFSKAASKSADSGVYSVKATNEVGSVETSTVVLVTSDATSPVVVYPPVSHTVPPGGTVAFSANAQAALQTIRGAALGDIRSTPTASNLFGTSLSYQWLKNGVAILGATKSTLVLHGVTADDTGSYQCLITSDLGSVLSSAGVLTLAADNTVSYLSNISIRSVTSEGSGTLIMGFVVGGAGTSGNKQVLVRGNGPSLDLFEVKGFIPDPVLAVYDNAKTLVAQNQGWNSASNADAIASAVASVGAYPIVTTSKDSAALLTVQAGPFSAHVREASGTEGVALAEVYDATPAAQMTTTSPRLVNISGRVLTGSGARTLIAGFVVAGSSAKTVLIRGAGPVLNVFEVPGFLPDPKLTLFDNNKAVVASNQGWGGDAEIKAAASSVGAFSWGDAATLDSALLVTLEPGAYTAQVSGATGDSGVALVEIYELP